MPLFLSKKNKSHTSINRKTPGPIGICGMLLLELPLLKLIFALLLYFGVRILRFLK
jgi:hypothetical protein